ncbi:YidC/Oxa1 family membrane protein insertase [Homoserinimonas sp. A447]
MDFYSFAPIAAVLDTAYNAVTALITLLDPITGAASATAAIVLITLLVRTALIPVGVSQVRAEFTRKRLAPLLQELQRKYKKKPEVLQRKTMELYAAEKASPLAGCLPTLLQAPVLSTVYGLFILGSINGHTNALLSERLLGVPLGASLISGPGWPGALVFAGIMVVLAVVAWLSRRIAVKNAPTMTDAAPPALQNLAGPLSWLPFLTVVFAAVVPLAATLYLALTTAWTLVERIILRRLLAP